jgi:adenosine deaminase
VNVRSAIELLGAARIGHGVRILEDPDLVAVARDLGVVFELCLSSNLHSGVVEKLEAHPLLDMIQAGLRVTLNTDDPGISATCLTDEYLHAMRAFGLSLESIKGLILTAVQSVFLTKREQAELEEEFVALLFNAEPKDRR